MIFVKDDCGKANTLHILGVALKKINLKIASLRVSFDYSTAWSALIFKGCLQMYLPLAVEMGGVGGAVGGGISLSDVFSSHLFSPPLPVSTGRASKELTLNMQLIRMRFKAKMCFFFACKRPSQQLGGRGPFLCLLKGIFPVSSFCGRSLFPANPSGV